ncbi:MAG: hypothetical protein LUH21_07965 [Clostridiales bacterium]|nr:hypothetical protein [Clostridiales bacterium]
MSELWRLRQGPFAPFGNQNRTLQTRGNSRASCAETLIPGGVRGCLEKWSCVFVEHDMDKFSLIGVCGCGYSKSEGLQVMPCRFEIWGLSVENELWDKTNTFCKGK